MTKSTWLSVLIVCLGSRYVLACKYTVRDVGFLDIGSRSYRLYLLTDDEAPQGIQAAFSDASGAVLLDSNVEFEAVNTARQKDHAAVKLARQKGVKLSGMTGLLVSPDDDILEMPIATSSEPPGRNAWSWLEAAVTSPKREEIVQRTVQAYCVVLLIEGRDAAANQRAEHVVAEAVKEVADGMPQLPKPTKEPPAVVRIARSEIAAERVLLWSLGLNASRAKGPCVALLYGRGRWIGGVFERERITRQGLGDVMSLIGADCECGLDRRQMLGVMLPMRWDHRAQMECVKSLGFDPENPMVKVEVSQILSMGGETETRSGETLGLGLLAYSERVVEFSQQTDQEALSVRDGSQGRTAAAEPISGVSSARGEAEPARAQPAIRSPAVHVRPASDAEPIAAPDQPSATFGVTWAVIGGLALLIVVSSVVVVLRAQRRAV
jgi:hypothetical protein